MPRTADVVVIGGGINGVSIAYNLAKAGAAVTLVERSAIASGPTGRSCGIVRQHYSHPVTARMALRALRIFQNFGDVVGGECGFTPTGFILAVPESDREALEANVRMQRSVGIDTRLLSPQEVAELEPHAEVEGIAAAAYEPEAGYADAHLTATTYARRAEELGARFLTGTRALKIRVEAGRAAGVLTDKGPIEAGAVVVAAGPWSPLLTRTCGIGLPLGPCRVQVAMFRPPPEIRRHRIWIDTALGIYLRPESGPLMLVGSIEDRAAEGRVDDPDDYDEGIDFPVVTSYSERLVRRYPAMGAGEFFRGYAALYDVSPDWYPVLGPLPGVENLYCAAGSSGHGFKLAPVVGEMVAGLILGAFPADLSLEPFRYERFGRGEGATVAYGQRILG